MNNPLAFTLCTPIHLNHDNNVTVSHPSCPIPYTTTTATTIRTRNRFSPYVATAKRIHRPKSSIICTAAPTSSVPSGTTTTKIKPKTKTKTKPATKTDTRTGSTDEPATRHALEVLYEAAKAEEKAGRVESALRMYESLVTLHPTNGRAWVRYSSAVLRHDIACTEKNHEGLRDGSSDHARSILKRALKCNPGNAILWQTWADLEKSEDRLDVARKLFNRGLQANPALPSLYHSWGGMEYKTGNIQAARRLYQEGLRRCPTATRLFHALGILHDKRGNTKSARIILTQGLKIEPDNPYLHHALGVLEYRNGKVTVARECFTRAIHVDPRHTMTWLSLALLEEFEGNIDLARKYYGNGTLIERRTSNSNTIQLWQAWARMEEKQNNILKAIQLYKNAIHAHSKDAMLYCSYGKLLENMGEIEKARRLFTEGLSMKSGRHQAYLWQSIALLEQKQMNYDIARKLFNLGIYYTNSIKSVKKERAALIHAWAAMEWEQDKIDVSRKLFNHAVHIHDGCAWLWLWFGRFELSQHHVCIAKYYIQRCINLDPSDGSPWRVWAELERGEGQEEKAKFMFKRAAQLESSRELFQIDPESPLKRPWRKL